MVVGVGKCGAYIRLQGITKWDKRRGFESVEKVSSIVPSFPGIKPTLTLARWLRKKNLVLKVAPFFAISGRTRAVS